MSPGQTVHACEQRLSRLGDAWQSLFENVGVIPVVSVEFAFRFLEGEVVLERLKNERLRKLLARLLKSKDRWELTSPPAFYSIRSLLAQELCHGYDERIASLVAAGVKLLNNGDYVSALLARLEEHIRAGEPFDDDFDRLVGDLAVAFILKGFDASRVRSLMRDVFFDEKIAPDGILHTTFPSEIIGTLLPNLDATSKESVNAYNSALRQLLDSLTLTDRFKAICTFYRQEPRDLTYIFGVSGIKGRQSHTIGRTELYPPFITPKYNKTSELLGRTNIDCLNAAITQASLGSEEDRSRAAQRIQSDLDLIAFYITSRLPMEVDASKCIMLRNDGAIHGEALRNDRLGAAIEHKYFARDMDELAAHPESLKTVLDVGSILRRLEANSEVRIAEALRAISKSAQSGVLEDRLVNGWIAIEALMGRAPDKEAVAIEVIPALVVSNARWAIGWGLLHYLRNRLTKHVQGTGGTAFERVSDDLLRRSLVIVDPWANQDLRTFVATLDEWLALVPEETECHRRILHVREFYSDFSKAKKELYYLGQVAADDVVLIYQVRNRIVHHAFLDNPGMRYLVERTEGFGRLFMLAALQKPQIAAGRLIADEIVRAKQLLHHVEYDATFDLLGEEL